MFRFNIDLWREYTFEISADGFSLSDPSGRCINSHDVTVCYIRKPTFDDPLAVPEGGCLEAWIRSQISYICREIYNICNRDGKVRLVEKGAELRLGKVVQMRLASKYFQVPQWRIIKSAAPIAARTPMVTKPLVADFVEDYRVLYTTEVVPEELDLSFPWLLQQQIKAESDLTVVYVAGKCFGFSLDRGSFSGVDWRKCINKVELPWKPYVLSDRFAQNILDFMVEAGLSFGRLDFLATGDDINFLEVNPNGQWAWLDANGTNGVFDAVVEALTEGWN